MEHKSRETIQVLLARIWFPVVIYGCKSWTIKKGEHQRIDALELRCWRRLLRVPWTARRSNQSILKGISPAYSLEGLMLKFQYFSTEVLDVKVGLLRKLSAEELVLLNCGVGEDS